ncbi:MAG TPA: FHA domain-containing protein [Anaerolineales bacterium]|nr:FHA domain-containing protein [Anaerolineales bacterium]
MEQMGEDAPLIIAQVGPLNGQRWSLRTRLVIGRDQQCDITIADRQVSRQHAVLTPTKEGILLEDMDSKNGTHVNGNLIQQPILLQDGDLLQIALIQEFTYLSSDATLPLEDNLALFSGHPQQLLRLENRSRRVWIGDKEILPPLSVSQYRLLQELYENQGRVVSRARLIEAIWGEEQAVTVSEQALDALIRRLRDRLSDIDATHVFIVTVRGHGLRLDNPQLSD